MENIIFSKQEIAKLIAWGFILPAFIFYTSSYMMIIGYFVAGAYLYTFKKELNPAGIWFYGVAALLLGHMLVLALMFSIGAASAAAGALQ